MPMTEHPPGVAEAFQAEAMKREVLVYKALAAVAAALAVLGPEDKMHLMHQIEQLEHIGHTVR